MGRVVKLFISPGIGEPMQALVTVQALEGRGLQGDRYAIGRGSYSRTARQAIRHVSLIDREAIEAADEELNERGLVPFETGARHGAISSWKALTFTRCLAKSSGCGSVRMRGIEPTRPCHIPLRRPLTRPNFEKHAAIAEAYAQRSCQTASFRSAIS